MIFTISDKRLIELENGNGVFGVFGRDDAENAAKFCGDEITDLGRVEKYTRATVNKGGFSLIINLPCSDGKKTEIERLCFTKAKKLVCVTDNPDRIEKCANEAEEVTKDNILAAVITVLLKTDGVFLEGMEKKLAETEGALMEEKRVNCTHDVVSYRRTLMVMKRYYEQLLTAVNVISELEPSSSSEDYTKLSESVEKLSEDVLNLRDFVSQVREAYQAQVDISLNSVMKFLTVITTLFMPLSLIASWYGMNLKMPETELEYGYLIAIGLALATALISVIFFRKKKWF